MSTDVYICKSCGEIKGVADSLCEPEKKTINYVCVSCGQVADLPKKLCNPRDVVKLAKQEPPYSIF